MGWSDAYLRDSVRESVVLPSVEGGRAVSSEASVAAVHGEELTMAEYTAMVERDARRLVGMSFAEFRDRWEAGEYRDDPDPKVTAVAFYIR